MTQWEYCELRWQVSSRYDMVRPSVVFYRDPTRPWSPLDGTPEQLALKLGWDGWELVSVLSYEGTGAANGPEVHWYFKRPLNGNGRTPATSGQAAGNGTDKAR
ncbi:MAG TPA: hypothetical protein VIK33_14565 [Anaerolineae bacterium]